MDAPEEKPLIRGTKRAAASARKAEEEGQRVAETRRLEQAAMAADTPEELALRHVYGERHVEE